MPLSMRSRIYKALLKRIIKTRVQTINELRKDSGLEAMPPAILPKGIEYESVEIAGVPSEWLTPIGCASEMVIVHFHGGGYVSGSAELHRMLTGHLATVTRSRVLAPNYRLAPEHPFPAALDDALAVYRQLVDGGHDPRSIVLSGDSAGGGLILATVMSLRDAGEALPGAIVCMSPWADLACDSETCETLAEAEALLTVPVLRSWAAEYAGSFSLDDALLSPVNGDFSGFPPLLVQVGGDEILLDDARTVARKAEAAGVTVRLSVWDGLWHVWQVLGSLVPENERSFAEIAEFLDETMEKAKA